MKNIKRKLIKFLLASTSSVDRFNILPCPTLFGQFCCYVNLSERFCKRQQLCTPEKRKCISERKKVINEVNKDLNEN